MVFGLSVAQAAATLAATFVGLKIGLFTTSTVNAVMIVVVVSLILASVSATRFGARMPKPAVDTTRIGRVVLAHVDDAGRRPARCSSSPPALPAPTPGSCGRRTSWPTARRRPARSLAEQVEREITRLTLDAELEVRHDRSSPTDCCTPPAHTGRR